MEVIRFYGLDHFRYIKPRPIFECLYNVVL